MNLAGWRTHPMSDPTGRMSCPAGTALRMRMRFLPATQESASSVVTIYGADCIREGPVSSETEHRLGPKHMGNR